MNFKYLTKELIRRRGRTLTNLLIVAVLVAIFVVLSSVMVAYSAAIYLPFKTTGADMIIQKTSSQASNTPTSSIQLPFGKGVFDENEIQNIVSLNHVTNASKSLVLWRFDQGKFISIEGIEPGSYIGSKYSSWITSGRFLKPGEENKAVVEKHFAKFYNLKLSNTLQLGNTTFEIVGIIAIQGEGQVSATNIYTNLADAQQLLGTTGYSQMYISLDSLSSEDTVRSEISQIDQNALVVSGSSIAASLSNVVKIYQQFHFLVLAIIAIILGLILFQVNSASLMERRKDIGVLQTIGWTKTNVSRQIVSEVFLQMISGFIIGIGVSFLTLAAIGSINIQTNASQTLGNNLSTITAPLSMSVSAAGQFLLLIVGISIIVSLLLVRKLTGMKPLLNLKNV
jgi:putative ABC transport system permease protein